MERAKSKVHELDNAWKKFQTVVAARIQEQQKSYQEQRSEALQTYQAKVPKLQEAERELKSKTTEAGALSLEDEASNEVLQEMLKQAADAMPSGEAMEDDKESKVEFPADLKPFRRFANKLAQKEAGRSRAQRVQSEEMMFLAKGAT